MRKTPSYLKGLAETRARVSAEVLRYEQILNEVGQALEKGRAELTACDTLIKKFDDRLDPRLIAPIKAWKGKYGKRGALQDAIIRILKERAPGPITTTELGWLLQLEFRLDFVDWREKRNWLHRSVGNQLNVLIERGLVERLHDRTVSTGQTGSWCWIGEGCKSLGDLAALAELSGVATSSAAEPYEAEEYSATDDLPV
ncbi:hypothetical protein [Thiobacillus sp.]|uniref:hypothetical protein n=1 Tax=Thiobacillus sp. TaxID=924 RepID=UPI0025CC81A0|nr:hypothetical protein [Thiobacillus sp.]MBT9538311.1 hypothetical protein [Thiobacillus sp.]